jgi:2,3-bisphosphoglycerate-dependent phosphoglycerate mutase
MELTFVRHAQPEWYVDDLHQGNDPGLSELGFRQAELLADALILEHFDEIYVSPMLRARQTVAPLLKRLDRQEVILPWLHEIKDPPWDGVPRSDVAQAYANEDLLALEDRWKGLPGGERIDDFQNRIVRDLETFLKGYGIVENNHDIPTWSAIHGTAVERTNGPKVLCVAHGGTNAVVTARLLGANRTPFEWFRFWYSHVTIGRLHAKAASGSVFFALRSLETAHIPLDMQTH